MMSTEGRAAQARAIFFLKSWGAGLVRGEYAVVATGIAVCLVSKRIP